MIQAARSGKQNIAEGSAASTTSSETEIKLMNVAKASLQELLLDYEGYLRVRDLVIWEVGDAKAKAARLYCSRNNDSARYRKAIQVRSAETIANIAITLKHQEDVLLRNYISRIKTDFLRQGGVREQMTRARIDYRNTHH